VRASIADPTAICFAVLIWWGTFDNPSLGAIPPVILLTSGAVHTYFCFWKCMKYHVLKPGNRRSVAAFIDGRAHGFRAARDAIQQAQQQLAEARTATARLVEDLQHAKHRYELAKSIIARAVAIESMRERDASVTLTTCAWATRPKNSR
jgi:hypothetical protein